MPGPHFAPPSQPQGQPMCGNDSQLQMLLRRGQAETIRLPPPMPPQVFGGNTPRAPDPTTNSDCFNSFRFVS
eukprot:6178959-Pleurochrysis_carterae.AAC.1